MVDKILHVIVSIYRAIFAKPVFRKFNYMMFRLGLSGLGVLNYESDKVSGENNFITNVLPKYIKSATPVLFDVGANVGKYSKKLSDRFPSAIILAFEPHPENYNKLCENQCNNIKVFNLGLSDSAGELTLFDRSDMDGSMHASLHKSVIDELHKKDITEHKVEVEILDSIAKSEEIDYIDFLKIDTEGNELAVLNGAIDMLKKGSIGCIHFEFNEMNVISRVFMRDFRKLLHDFDLYRLLPAGMLKLDDYPLTTELFAYQNIVAIRR